MVTARLVSIQWGRRLIRGCRTLILMLFDRRLQERNRNNTAETETLKRKRDVLAHQKQNTACEKSRNRTQLVRDPAWDLQRGDFRSQGSAVYVRSWPCGRIRDRTFTSLTRTQRKERAGESQLDGSQTQPCHSPGLIPPASHNAPEQQGKCSCVRGEQEVKIRMWLKRFTELWSRVKHLSL